MVLPLILPFCPLALISHNFLPSNIALALAIYVAWIATKRAHARANLFSKTLCEIIQKGTRAKKGQNHKLIECPDDFRCFPMFSAVFQCFPTVFQLFSDDVFRLLKSSSSWTKLSMVGPQLFLGWYQMILDVFRCSQQVSNVFRLFSNCFPTMFSDVQTRFRLGSD